MGTISLDEFIDIKTVYQDIPTQRKSLDLGLLVGTIPQNEGSDIFTDSERIRIYSSLTEMADDGFPSTNDLYKSASLFFSQDNHPKKLAIGKIGSVIEANTANEGEILLADAKELNVNAEVGKYIYQGRKKKANELEDSFSYRSQEKMNNKDIMNSIYNSKYHNKNIII